VTEHWSAGSDQSRSTPSGVPVGELGQPVLAGLRVVDLTVGIAGSYCTKLLRDAGADVVMVEPASGHPLRSRQATERPLAAGEDSPLFRFLAAGKRSVPTDDADDSVPGAVVEELLALADIVVCDSALPNAVGPTLAAADAGLIVVSITPFGLTGPWSERVASDLTLQALSSSVTGRGDRHGTPVRAGGVLSQWASGVAAAAAALIAVRRRRATGLGEHIDLSELEVAITIFNGFRGVSGQLVPAGPPPYQVVEVPSIEPAADGWIGFATLSGDQFSNFAAMIDHPEWAVDPEISRIDVRIDRAAELRRKIAAWTGLHPVDEILQLAAERRIPTAPVGDGATTPELPHLVERQAFVAAPGESYAQPRVPYRLGRSEQPGFDPPPGRGTTDPGSVARHWSGRQEDEAPTDGPAGHPDLPLSGIKVFDFTSFWAGPFTSQILGYFGAEVIKVESVQRPDGTRMATSYGIRGDRVWERAPLFQAVNTGKRGITLDLGRPEGRELGQRLLAECDVLIENYSPRVAERFGLVDEGRRDLITVRMPAWGLTGPWRDLPGFAQTMEQASGLAWVTGFADGPPLIPRGPCDPIGALHGAFAVMAAILDRDRTGLGQLVEVPLVESALNVAAEQVVEYGNSATLLGRRGNAHPTAAPHGVYPTLGGSWVAIAVMDDDQWRNFAMALSHPTWTLQPDLGRAAGRVAARHELDGRLSGWCASRSPEEIVELLWAAGVPAAPLVPPHEVVGLAQTEHRGFFEEVDHPVIGPLKLPVFPARFSSRSLPYHSTHAPLLGQDNAEVLGGWLGVDDDELASLKDTGVIGDRPL
jgi:crotonobetainyl-CoA:carnitine CoA-transferase CaiB-like acyl-CoA transferase